MPWCGTQTSGSSRLSSLGLAVILGLASLLGAFAPLCVAYFEGISNHHVSFPWMLVVFLLIPVVKWVCLAGLLVLALVALIKKRHVIAWLIGLFILLGGIGICLWGLPSNGSVFLKGFRKYIRSRVDIHDIREWLGSFKGVNGVEGVRFLEPVDWPPGIERLSPEYVWLVSENEVQITWGGGFGHWGLTVRTDDFDAVSSGIVGDRLVSPCSYVWDSP